MKEQIEQEQFILSKAENFATQLACKMEINERQSIYYNQYMAFLAKYKKQDCFRLQNFQKNLKQNKIRLKSSEDNLQQIVLINKTQSSRVVELLVKIRAFSFQIVVLNLSRATTTFKQLELISSGSYGSVFSFCNHENLGCAVKVIKHSFEKNQKTECFDNLRPHIYKVVVQYCYMKLFSVLKIGPHVQNIFGFDLIIYDDSIEFSMELCAPMKNQYIEDLRNSLCFMHKLNIIHGDVKPQNIMWSPTFNKNVFIDFGLSQNLKQKPGFCTRTTYFGSFKYSSPEMKDVFFKGGYGFVDLFFNDVYGLTQVLLLQEDRALQRFLKLQAHKATLSDKFEDKVNNFKLMNLLYQRNIAGVYQFLELKKFALCNQAQTLLSQIPALWLDKFHKKLKNSSTSFNHQRLKQNQQQAQKFQSRMQSIVQKHNETGQDCVIQFLLLVSNQDLTYRRFLKKNQCAQILISYDLSNSQFWKCFLQFCYNPFTSSQQILQRMEKIIHAIGIQWRVPYHSQLEVFFKAYQLSNAVLQKYGIDLFELRKQLGLDMLGWLKRSDSIQQLDQVQLSQDEKNILKSNWHAFRRVDLRSIMSDYESDGLISQFLRQSKAIKSPGPLFQYFISYSNFLIAQNINISMLSFLESLKKNPLVMKTKFFCEICNQVHRGRLRQLKLGGILNNCLDFCKFGYNCCFQLYLCRHAYFIELMLGPCCNNIPSEIIKIGVSQIFSMAKESEPFDYFFQDLSFFLNLVARRYPNDDKYTSIRSHVNSLLEKHLLYDKKAAAADFQNCLEILILLNTCFSPSPVSQDYRFLSSVISLLRTKIEKCQLSVQKLKYYLTEVNFFQAHCYSDWSEKISAIVLELYQKYSSNVCQRASNYSFLVLCYALDLRKDFSQSFWAQKLQEASKIIKRSSIRTKNYHYVYLSVLSKYFIKFQKQDQCFQHLVNLLKDFQNQQYSGGGDVQFYLFAKKYLKSLYSGFNQTIITHFVKLFEQLAYKEARTICKMPILTILIQFILDAVYANKNNQAQIISQNSLNLIFKWAHIWLPSCFQVLRRRFQNKISIYIAKFSQKSQLSFKGEHLKHCYLKILRNSQYHFSNSTIKNLLDKVKSKKNCKQASGAHWSKVKNKFYQINQNKQKFVNVQVSFDGEASAYYQELINSNSIDLLVQNKTGKFDETLISKNQQQIEKQMFNILFASI